ncbi:MAG: type II toxin-antitoxin system RelE/ParE family toxin [Rhodoferax sp.]
MSSPRFHPDALRELLAQASYYEDQDQGLGQRFVAEVESALGLANLMPGIGCPYLQGTRRVFPKGFPHSVVYRMSGDTLVVLAVAPFKRKPGYWSKRR